MTSLFRVLGGSFPRRLKNRSFVARALLSGSREQSRPMQITSSYYSATLSTRALEFAPAEIR